MTLSNVAALFVATGGAYYGYVGGSTPPELDWRRLPGTAQCGWFDRIKPTLSKREAMSTPPAFRDVLISLARHTSVV